MKLVRCQMREQYRASMCVCGLGVGAEMSIRWRVESPLQKVYVSSCSIASFKPSRSCFHVTAAVFGSGAWEW
jgi:hypothetical protein